MNFEQKINELKIKLPEAKAPVGSYMATKISGKLLFISGQISIDENGELIKGKVGKDLDTDEFVVDFDSNYTKVSCDSTSNYFTLYMNGLEPERYYKILIRSTVGATTTIFDNDYIFKVVNG